MLAEIRKVRMNNRKIWITIVACGLNVGVRLEAQTPACQAPSSKEIDQARTFIALSDKIEDFSLLRLVESAQENEACYWRLTFAKGSSERKRSAYLSPDRVYVSGDLYTLADDSLASRLIYSKNTAAELTDGSPPERGAANAKTTIVEFIDFQCPSCDVWDKEVKKRLDAKKLAGVKIIFRNFPLRGHDWAMSAAELAACAGDQRKDEFWVVHDYLTVYQTDINIDNIYSRVMSLMRKENGINQERLANCMEMHTMRPRIAADKELGRRNGVERTPTLFINGVLYSGALSLPAFTAILNATQEQVK